MTPTSTIPSPDRPRVTLLAVVQSLHEFTRSSAAKRDYYASDLSQVVSDAIVRAHLKQARRVLGLRKNQIPLPATSSEET